MSEKQDDRDFTIEYFLPLGNKEKSDDWHHLSINKAASQTHVHTQETIDGVLFLVREVYDDKSKLLEKHMVRADQVKG